MATIALITFGAGIWLAYKISLRNQQTKLEAIASHNAALISTLLKSQDRKEVINILRRSYLYTDPLIGNNEIMIGEGRHGYLVCLIFYSWYTQTCPNLLDSPTHWNSALRQALQKQNGVTIGLNHNGKKAIAAYQYIPEVNWAIVVQSDLNQFQAPFRRLVMILLVVIITLESVGIMLFFKLNKLAIIPNDKAKFASQEQFLSDLNGEINNLLCILENSNNLLVMLDDQGQIIFINHSAEAVIGLSQNDLIGTNFTDLLVDSEAVDQLNNIFTDKAQPSNTINYRNKLKKQDQSTVVIDWTSSLIFHQAGGIKYLIQNGVDVTNKITNEQKLIDIQNQFKAIFESSELGIAILDSEGVLRRHNHKLWSLLGKASVTMGQSKFVDFIQPQYQQKFGQFYQAIVLGDRHGFEQEISATVEGDKNLNLALNTVGLRNENDEFQLAIILLKDVTPYKSIEKARVELIERNQLLINALGEIVYCHNLETDTIEWQGNYLSILGYDAQSMGNNDKIRKNRIHPDDLPQVEEEMKNAWEEKRMFDIEYRFQAMDGEYPWFHDRGIIRSKDNQPWQIIGVMLDISDRKSLEQQRSQIESVYQQFMSTTAEGIWIIDMAGKTTFINQTMVDAIGYTTEEIQGKSFLDFMHPDDAQLALEKLQTRLDGNQEVHDFRFLHRDGSEVWFLIAADPFRDHQGNVTGALGMFTNITEKKIIEMDLLLTNEKLAETVSKLERINYMYGTFNRLTDFLQACKSKQEAYKIIPQFLQQIFPSISGAIFEISEDANSLVLVLSWGSPNSIEYFTQQDCWALRRNSINHYTVNAFDSVPCSHLAQDENCQETLCLPLMIDESHSGLLFFCSSVAGTFDHINKQLAKTISESISLTLGNLKLRETLLTQNIKDPLTGLYNRRYWETALKREIHKAERNRSPLTVVMIDIDHFKQLNDRWGHRAGDVVLVKLAQLLLDYFRLSDLVCRYGGEEFLVILPDAPLTYARERTEAFRQLLKEQNMGESESDFKQITVSFGLASFPDQAENFQQLLQRSDQALYMAKHQGRDRVVVFESPGNADSTTETSGDVIGINSNEP
ncbi:PAS domain S-box protein [Synechocystis sp. FACHB-383]|uniref:PAS domain S-box protein n=1 Tax=Synechocystis sp. FACHB-383 TaxID=2692864 RepID=UPI00168869E0|nr:PAS domain S-box protein [Synechocystis sp. FACHB-383]